MKLKNGTEALKSVLEFLRRLNIHFLCDPVMLFLCIYLRILKTHAHSQICIPMLIAAVPLIAKNWNKWSSVSDLTNKTIAHSYKGIQLNNKNELLTNNATWMEHTYLCQFKEASLNDYILQDLIIWSARKAQRMKIASGCHGLESSIWIQIEQGRWLSWNVNNCSISQIWWHLHKSANVLHLTESYTKEIDQKMVD